MRRHSADPVPATVVGDDESTGSITRSQLAGPRDSSAYTDRMRLRDILGGHSVRPFPFSL